MDINAIESSQVRIVNERIINQIFLRNCSKLVMETRIIDLIKNPETLRVEDLNLLETEIEKFPYMQSLRAIYLLGVHSFYNEHSQKNWQKLLPIRQTREFCTI